jgi:hypothetical protein
MPAILGIVSGLYLVIGFVVLFRRLRERTVYFNVADPQNGEWFAWFAVAAMWPLYFCAHRKGGGAKPDDA